MMSKTIQFQGVITTILKEVTPYVYFEIALTPDHYPYVMFEFVELLLDYDRIPIQLEINVIGTDADTEAMGVMADLIQQKLDHYYYLDENMQFRTYKGNRNNIKEENVEYIKRQLLFDVSLYERSKK